jgi:hypothetical protein
MNPDRSASSPGTEQAGQGDHDPDAVFLGPSHEPGCGIGWAVRDRVDRFADGFAVTIQALQLGAEEFAGVRVNVFDFKPVGVFCGFVVLKGEPAEQQVGEQIGAALLFGSWIVSTQAARHGGQRGVDGGGVGCGHLAGDIAHAVGALYDGDPAFGEGAAVALLEGQWFQLHH